MYGLALGIWVSQFEVRLRQHGAADLGEKQVNFLKLVETHQAHKLAICMLKSRTSRRGHITEQWVSCSEDPTRP